MKVGAATDIGLIRMMNQDSYYCSSGVEDPCLFIVADGMADTMAGR